MTRRLGRGDTVRGRARLALAIVALMAGGLVATLAPGGTLSTALATVSGTPTATTTETNTPGPTTTPPPAGTPTIQLLNPSAYVSPVVVSNKTDTDSNYHLVAWVAQSSSVPDPVVRFQISGGPTLLATREGTSPVWHAFWDVAQPDGDYTVTATLSSGPDGPPISSDSQAVEVKKAYETVEITYPTTAGPLGTFNPQAARRGFVIDVTVSADATGVQVFYGTSPGGTEQNWRRCVQQETVEFSEGRTRRIGCIVDDVDVTSAGLITGVAAVATGVHEVEIPPQCTDPAPSTPPTCATADSGDAHRVFAYDQVASSLTIDPTSSSSDPATCQVLTAAVSDNQGRPIWRANLDVHARGPGDGLQFARVIGTTRDWQPPDAFHSAHQGTEETHDCGDSGLPPMQAEHNISSGADQKHIETKFGDEPEGGADTSGRFTFALRSLVSGHTEVEAWGDIDYNDTPFGNPVSEPVGTATVTWTGGTPSESPTGSRSPTGSPTGTRSPSGSPTATRSPSTSPTATGSPSTSPTATRSPTASPSPSPTPTRSASASASESAPPPQSNRTITLEPSDLGLPVDYRSKIEFTGLVDSPNLSCQDEETVTISRRPADESDFREIGTAVTRANGMYRFVVSDPRQNADYIASVDETATCAAAISDPVGVGVRVLVKIRSSDDEVEESERNKILVTFFGRVRPCGDHSKTNLKLLDRSKGDGFNEDNRTEELDGTCRAQFKQRVRKTTRYRMLWPSQDDDHAAGSSDTITVKVVRDD